MKKNAKQCNDMALNTEKKGVDLSGYIKSLFHQKNTNDFYIPNNQNYVATAA